MQPAVGDTEVRLTLPTGELVLADGRVVKPLRIQQVESAATVGREVENGRAASATLERVHRKLGDLPETPERMNAIATVLVYESVGLSISDMAIALRTSTENIERVLEMDAYKQLKEMFDTAVFEDTKRAANHIIARASAKAAQKMTGALDVDDPNIYLTASRDVLKLAGVGTDKSSEGKISGLNIKIIRKGEKEDDQLTVEINNG